MKLSRGTKVVFGRARHGWTWTMLVFDEMGRSTALAVVTLWAAVSRGVFASK
jgi:hypothetical protein